MVPLIYSVLKQLLKREFYVDIIALFSMGMNPGDLLLIKPGEVIPVDGLVMGEIAVLDESALTTPFDRLPMGTGGNKPEVFVMHPIRFRDYWQL